MHFIQWSWQRVYLEIPRTQHTWYWISVVIAPIRRQNIVSKWQITDFPDFLLCFLSIESFRFCRFAGVGGLFWPESIDLIAVGFPCCVPCSYYLPLKYQWAWAAHWLDCPRFNSICWSRLLQNQKRVHWISQQNIPCGEWYFPAENPIGSFWYIASQHPMSRWEIPGEDGKSQVKIPGEDGKSQVKNPRWGWDFWPGIL